MRVQVSGRNPIFRCSPLRCPPLRPPELFQSLCHTRQRRGENKLATLSNMCRAIAFPRISSPRPWIMRILGSNELASNKHKKKARLMKGRPTPKNTHPNKNTVCANNFGTVCANCTPFPLKISRSAQKEFAQTVCANCFSLGGWVFFGWAASPCLTELRKPRT